jgi:hypothetical protein
MLTLNISLNISFQHYPYCLNLNLQHNCYPQILTTNLIIKPKLHNVALFLILVNIVNSYTSTITLNVITKRP